MSETIKDLGGLSEGEIDARILRNNAERDAVLDKKLGEQREAIEKRLTAQDEVLKPLQTDMAMLVGTDKLPGMIPQQTELIKELVTKHDKWHGEDLLYRTDMIERVTRVEKHQAYHKQQLQLLSWVIRFSSATLRAATTVVTVSSKGRDVWKAIISAGIVWAAAREFYLRFWPFLVWCAHKR